MARTTGYQRRSTTAADQDSDQETEHSPCRCLGILFALFGLFLCLIPWISLIRSWPPDDIKIAVTDASLTEFNITSSNNYNLDLNITLRNPNKDFGIYYDKALVVADYRKASAVASIADFHQPAKNTTLLTPSLKLQRDNISDDVVGSGKRNYYDIVVTLHLPKKYKSVTWWKDDCLSSTQLYTCDLKVPLQNGSQSATSAFNTTKCQSRYRFDCN